MFISCTYMMWLIMIKCPIHSPCGSYKIYICISPNHFELHEIYVENLQSPSKGRCPGKNIPLPYKAKA